MLTNDVHVINTLAVLAVVSTIFYRLVHVGDFVLASRQGPTGTIDKLNGIQFVLMFFEGILWIRYAINDLLLSVYIAESMTFISGLLYTLAWSITLTWQRQVAHVVVGLMAAAAAILIILMGTVYFIIPDNNALQTEIFGYTSVAGSIIWNLYPFLSWAITRRSDTVTTLLSVALLINGQLWFYYALTIDNIYLIITGNIRTVCGLIQFIVSLVRGASWYNVPKYVPDSGDETEQSLIEQSNKSKELYNKAIV